MFVWIQKYASVHLNVGKILRN